MLRHVHAVAAVQADDLHFLLERGLLERPAFPEPRIDAGHVHRPARGLDRAPQGHVVVELAQIADIARHLDVERPEVPLRLRGQLPLLARDHQIVAVLGQLLREMIPDTVRSAGYQRQTFTCHGASPCFLLGCRHRRQACSACFRAQK